EKRILDDIGSKTYIAFVDSFLDSRLVAYLQHLDDAENFDTVPKSSFGDLADTLDIQGWDALLGVPRGLHPQSSSASRFTAGASGFLNLTQSFDRPDRYRD